MLLSRTAAGNREPNIFSDMSDGKLYKSDRGLSIMLFRRKTEYTEVDNNVESEAANLGKNFFLIYC